ncbi:hypothetical protein INQ51_08885 [Maribellus sp. CM-23]|uniref:hypothetical protein n=1 Tax=Maribellus sp. CM-23 TaxID=2781026 RepID=UPI001F2CC400|nr:hypothetical protein [Maribellus sp. CM-23]MCE4564423.1 hypothetical protein [Maribellus sp. CM-23]
MNLPNINNDNGVVAVNTKADDNVKQIIAITHTYTTTGIVNVEQALLSDSLSIFYSSKQTGKVLSKFDFSIEIAQSKQTNKENKYSTI